MIKNHLIIGVFIFCSLTGLSYAAEDRYHSPEQLSGVTTTSLAQAKTLFDNKIVFIDVRNSRYFARGHIPGAYHLDFKYNFDEAKLAAIVKKDQVFVLYCSGVKCSRSYRASEKALSWGYTKVHYFRGGIVDWKKASYPIEVDSEISE